MDLSENDLRAAIKGLSDVVAPSVDKQDALAVEQLRLVIDYLNFLRSRIDLLGQRDRLELRQSLKMAQALHGLGAADPETQSALALKITESTACLFDPDPLPSQMKRVKAELLAVIREGTRKAKLWPDTHSHAWENCVIQCSLEGIHFEQSWYLPLGFEPAPSEVPALSHFLNAGK